MARPVKRRRVCGLPPVGAFRPEGGPGGPVIEVTVDEYEAVRLIGPAGADSGGVSCPDECGPSTVQAIYDSAREKLARCWQEGRPLPSGGTYEPVRSGGALLRPALPPPGRGRGPVRKRPPDPAGRRAAARDGLEWNRTG